MNFDDMSTAVRQAEAQINLADKFVAKMADLIAGRLRKSGVGYSALRKLKTELRDYNIHTNKWKDE